MLLSQVRICVVSLEQVDLIFRSVTSPSDLEYLPAVWAHSDFCISNYSLHGFIRHVHNSPAVLNSLGLDGFIFSPSTVPAGNVCMQHSIAYWLLNWELEWFQLPNLAQDQRLDEILCIIAVKGATFCNCLTAACEISSFNRSPYHLPCILSKAKAETAS
jgi:hypothetical protein